MWPREFWKHSPAEQDIVFEGAAARQKDDLERALFLAWHVAAFTRAKRLPKWETVRTQLRREPKKPQDWRVMKEFLKELKGVKPADLSPKEQRMMARKQKHAHGR